MRYYGGIHLDIQEFIKTVVNKRGGPIEDSSFNGVHNTPSFFNLFEMMWFVTAYSRVMRLEGILLHGKDQILRGFENTQDALYLREIDGPARLFTTVLMHPCISGWINP